MGRRSLHSKENVIMLVLITHMEELFFTQADLPSFAPFSVSSGPFETKSCANGSYRSPAHAFTDP